MNSFNITINWLDTNKYEYSNKIIISNKIINDEKENDDKAELEII